MNHFRSLAVALLAICSLQSAANAQEFISNGHSSAMSGFDNFTASLDVTAAMMSKLYDERVTAFHHNYQANAIGNLMNNQTPLEFQARRTTTAQILSQNGSNQSAYNQGNNQGNNGYFAGGFPNGVGLPVFDNPVLNGNNPLNTGINRNFVNTSSTFPHN